MYDLGGGTFDVSIVECDGPKLTVLSTMGETFLGGGDFDVEIYKEAVARFKEEGEENIVQVMLYLSNNNKSR